MFYIQHSTTLFALRAECVASRTGFYRSYLEAERRGLVFVNPRRNFGKADTLEKALEEKQFRIKNLVRGWDLFFLVCRAVVVGHGANRALSKRIVSRVFAAFYLFSQNVTGVAIVRGCIVGRALFRTHISKPFRLFSHKCTLATLVLLPCRCGGQVDPATGEVLHELEHEIRSISHPSYPVGRDLSALTPM